MNERPHAVFSAFWASLLLLLLVGTVANATPIGDTLTVIQRPLLNIPAIVRLGDTMTIECDAGSGTSGWAAELIRDQVQIPMVILGSSYDPSTLWWEIQAVVPAVPVYELYDLVVTANGGIVDTTWNAVQVISDFRDDYYFIHITDPHLPTHLYYYQSGADTDSSELVDMREVIGDINIINPEFVLITGDYINEGELEEFLDKRYFSRCQRLLAEFDVPVYLTSGNHDIGGWDDTPPPDGTARTNWWRFFGWRRLDDPPAGAPWYTQNFSFDYGPVHYTGLEAYNNYDNWRSAIYGSDSFTSGQMQWLSDDIAASSSSAAHVLFYHADFSNQINLGSLGVDMALSGHIHRDDDDFSHPYDIVTNNVCDDERSYRLVRVSSGVLQPTSTISAGSGGNNLAVDYSPANDGTHYTVTADITNDIDERFEHANLRFVMPKEPGTFDVTGGTLLQIDDSGPYSICYVGVDILASSSPTVSITLTPGSSDPPEVTVTSPNGGETWDIDSFFDITWVATDDVGVTSIDILLSSDGGATYPHTIATGETNDGVYSWQVDVAPTTQARVKVIAYDADTNTGEDISDGNFTISDDTPPEVTVTAPNGGETWDIDSFFDITWVATDNIGVTSIDILLSSDGGATYPHTIATGEVNDGIFSWQVDVAPTTQARVKVIAYDAATNSGEDVSNGDFEISDGEAPDVTVTAPNGGENWEIDSFFDITWSATDNIGVTSIDILLSSDGGATYPHTIATGETNDGMFSWQVDVAPTTQARIKVIAYDAATNSGEDVSNGDFEISDGEAPDVTVTAPNGGETWAVDSFFDITWSATDNIGVTSIDILLSSDGGATYPHTIATGETNDGIFSWQVDVASTSQARVKVIAYDAATNSGEDVSNGDFEISDGEAPDVTVTAPNGGEVWEIDSFFDITWSATDNIGVTSIDILLSSDGGATYPHTIATGEVNDGIFSWQVDVAPTTQARVKVIAYDSATNSGEDVSNGDFEIYDPTSGVVQEPDVPAHIVIAGAQPNPFSDQAAIRFGLPGAGHVRMDVYDVSGRLITNLTDRSYEAGYHTVDWVVEGGVGTGLYFLKLRFGGEEINHKVVVSR